MERNECVDERMLWDEGQQVDHAVDKAKGSSECSHLVNGWEWVTSSVAFSPSSILLTALDLAKLRISAANKIRYIFDFGSCDTEKDKERDDTLATAVLYG